MMHRKLWLFDGILACVASMNSTYNSTHYCSEAGVILTDADCVLYLAAEFEIDWSASEPLRLTTEAEGVSGDIMLDYTGKRLQFDGLFLGKSDAADQEGYTADPPRRSGPGHPDPSARPRTASEDEPSGEYRSPHTRQPWQRARPRTPEGTPNDAPTICRPCNDPIRRAPSTRGRANSRHDFVASPGGRVYPASQVTYDQ